MSSLRAVVLLPVMVFNSHTSVSLQWNAAAGLTAPTNASLLRLSL